MKFLNLLLVAFIVLSAWTVEAKKTNKVYFLEPVDGAVVTSPVHVKMAVSKDLKVEKSGQVRKNAGHHHIIVNAAPVAAGQVIKNDEKHIHYGAGQSEAQLELKPGHYKLLLQFADGVHKSYGKEYSQEIKIEVK